MEFIFSIILLAAVLVFIIAKIKPNAALLKTSRSSTPEKPRPKQDLDWLNARWEVAEAAKESGDFSYFKPWYFDPVTPAQLEKLKAEGASLLGEPTKGQASDALGIFEDPEPEDVEVLRFFKKSKPRISSTQAKELVRIIFSEPANSELWARRPPADIVKIFCSIYGIKLPKDLTHIQAKTTVDDLASADERMETTWCELENVLDDLGDGQTREDYSIKKPSVTQITSAVKSILLNGDEIDTSSVVDRLLKLYPTLDR